MFSFFSRKKAEEPPQPPAPVPVALTPPVKPIEVPEPQQQATDPRRVVRQLGLFFAGATFLTMSTLITRRSVARKMNQALPKLFHPSHRAPMAKAEGGEGQLIAVEALGLATLNVFSFAIMATGGLAWAFDVTSVEDVRRRARKSLYGKGEGNADEEAEREIEEWMASVLSRKDKKEQDGKGSSEGKEG